MLNLSLRDGSDIKIDGKKIIRIRRTISDWDDNLGNTRFDWFLAEYVMEDAGMVAKMAREDGLEHLASLTIPGGTPVWFNARAAIGPVPVASQHVGSGANSAFEVGNRIQHVSETHEQVAQVIGRSGGVVLSIPRPSLIGAAIERVENWATGIGPEVRETLDEWDPGLLSRLVANRT